MHLAVVNWNQKVIKPDVEKKGLKMYKKDIQKKNHQSKSEKQKCLLTFFSFFWHLF